MGVALTIALATAVPAALDARAAVPQQGTGPAPATPQAAPQAAPQTPRAPAPLPPPLSLSDAEASSPEQMKRYRERIPGSDASFDMLPIPGGEFAMGSPESEAGRKPDEGPRHSVRVAPFWMGRCEVTWDEYHVFMLQLDRKLAAGAAGEAAPRSEQDRSADAVSRPTPPYVPMDFEMGVSGYPAVCMTQFAARQYTEWLSRKTGRVYRLPTEAEWEYACRAGSSGAYAFGDDAQALDDFAWSFRNSHDRYQKVGTRKPNAWGLCDMHGNVAEWCLDRYDADAYRALGEGPAADPVAWPSALHPRVVRGGSYDDDPPRLRSAARRGSNASWSVRDPQLPKSIWYHTDATFVGFRVVRPLATPGADELARAWDADVPEVREVQERQRNGGR